MVRFNQEGNIGAVNDVEGGKVLVEEGEGVVGDDGFRHRWRGVDAVQVDTDQLQDEKENSEEEVFSPPQHL